MYHNCITYIYDIDYSRPLLSGTISRPYYHAGTNIKHHQSSVEFVKSHQWKRYGLLLQLLWKTSSGSKTSPTQIQPYLPRHQLPLASEQLFVEQTFWKPDFKSYSQASRLPKPYKKLLFASCFQTNQWTITYTSLYLLLGPCYWFLKEYF